MSESESELEHKRAVLLAQTRYGSLLEAAPDAMVISADDSFVAEE